MQKALPVDLVAFDRMDPFGQEQIRMIPVLQVELDRLLKRLVKLLERVAGRVATRQLWTDGPIAVGLESRWMTTSISTVSWPWSR